MASNKIEIHPTKTEPVPEETYVDLLPFEMERLEASMAIMTRLNKTSSKEEKEVLSNIRTEITSAKMEKENSWGHQWRESPIIDEDMKPLSETTGLGSAKEAISKSYWDRAHEKPDPILAAVLEDKEAILDNAEGYDLISANSPRLTVGEEVKAAHRNYHEDEELPETD
jgi:hypothetical protein